MIYNNIYKLTYTWYEGETGACYVLTNLPQDEFEEVLVSLYKNLTGEYLPEKYGEIMENLSVIEGIDLTRDMYNLPDFCCLVEYNVDDDVIRRITQKSKIENL